MVNTPTTPSSVAPRLTDEEIETLAKKSEYDAIDCAARGRDELHYEYGAVAAVLRDYVRLRRLKKGVEEVAYSCSCSRTETLQRLLAEAEKGGSE